MDVKALSASRIKLWQTCKYQYGCRYHNFHPEVKIDRPEYFKIGTAVHAALEYAGKLVKDNKLKKFSKADVVEITKVYFTEASTENLTDPITLDDGLTLLLHKLNTFEFGYPIISLEKWFNIKVDDVPVVGAMDRVVTITPKHLCVIDYKTSRSALTDEEMANDIQVGLYDIVARLQYPKYHRYTVCLDYLRLFPKQINISAKRRKALKIQLGVVYEEILKAKKEDLKPQLHQFCPWCDYVSVCPKIKEVEEELSKVDAKKLIEKDHTEIADIYTKSKLLERVYKDLKDKAYAKLVGIIKGGNLDPIDTTGKAAVYKCGNYTISMRQNSYVSYDLDKAYDLLGTDRLLKCVDLNRNRFEREAKVAGISVEELDAIRNVNFSKPIIDVKQIKE